MSHGAIAIFTNKPDGLQMFCCGKATGKTWYSRQIWRGRFNDTSLEHLLGIFDARRRRSLSCI